MLDWTAASTAFVAMIVLALVGWLISLARRDVSIVDSLWSLFFLTALAVYSWRVGASGARTTILLVLVAIWALRLAIYLTARNWSHEEDRRYQAIRARNEPGFEWKSFYLVFLLQAILAAIIAAPLLAVAAGDATVGLTGSSTSGAALGVLEYAGIALWVIGFGFEAVGDWQLARFKGEPSNRGQVLDTGVWRYTRHPNYFGEATLWWGYYLIAVAAGGAWTVFAPVLMTVLLLKVSGVALLEKDIGIAHELAVELGVSDPVLAHAREQFRTLRADLGESADYLDPIRVAERAAGVELRG